MPPAESLRRARIRWLGAVLLACTALLSVLWWRADVARCACEYCPDEHCVYAEHVRSFLAAPGADSGRELLSYARGFLHAQIPLAAALAAVAALVVPSLPASMMLVGALATVITWRAVRRIVGEAWRPSAMTTALLAVAFFGNATVVHGFVRPISDAIGMLCTIWSLRALERHVAARSRPSALRLFALQLLGLFARPSFIPMLGMPVLAELVQRGDPSPRPGGRSSPGPHSSARSARPALRAGFDSWVSLLVRPTPADLASRLRRAIRGGVLFGIAPGLAYVAIVVGLGIEHTQWMWQSAHQAQYVAPDRLRVLLSSLVLAGGPYLLLGVIALVSARWRGDLVLRVHLAWIALYVGFLFLGGASLWLRYFAPLVPSVVIVATPLLDVLVRRRRAAAIALVALVALWHGVKVARWIGDPGALLSAVRGHAQERRTASSYRR